MQCLGLDMADNSQQNDTSVDKAGEDATEEEQQPPPQKEGQKTGKEGATPAKEELELAEEHRALCTEILNGFGPEHKETGEKIVAQFVAAQLEAQMVTRNAILEQVAAKLNMPLDAVKGMNKSVSSWKSYLDIQDQITKAGTKRPASDQPDEKQQQSQKTPKVPSGSSSSKSSAKSSNAAGKQPAEKQPVATSGNNSDGPDIDRILDVVRQGFQDGDNTKTSEFFFGKKSRPWTSV